MIRRLFRQAPNWYDEASAFVDGELAPDRQAAFSRELAGSAQLQHYVDELRATKTALAELPELEVPRPFTISVAQAQGSPTMTRRESVERTAPRGAGLLEGTLLMRGAATFSAVAIAALAAVVVVDLTQNDGDSQIFRDFAAVGQVASDAADDQDGTRGETAVAALAAEQSADQSAQAQAQAAPLVTPRLEEQAEAQAAQAVPEPALAELNSEADAAADMEVQTLTDAAETEDEAASDQTADQAAGDEGDPALAATASSDDTAAEEPPTDAQTPVEGEAEAVTDTTESTPTPTAELTAEAGATSQPIEQGTSGGQAEEADIARATAQSEDGAPPTIEPAPEAPTEATDDAADGATTETAATAAQTTSEAAGGGDSDRPTSNEEAEIEAPKPGTTTPSAANRTEQAAEQALSEAATGEPEQTPTAAALRHDSSEVVQILEIVLGIAAGLSVLTLLVTLYRSRA